MKRKMLSLLLVGVMAGSLLIGCGASGKDTAEQGSSQEQEQNPEKGSDGAENDEQELTTVKILCENLIMGDARTEDWENCLASQVLIDELAKRGIRLELELVDSESLSNVINTRMASGTDLPDLISAQRDNTKAVADWGKSGLVYSVNELLEQYDEDGSIKAFYDEYAPGAWEMNALEDGSVYWFSYLVGNMEAIDAFTGEPFPAVGMWSLSIRQDWVEAVGEEVKDVYTPDELFALLKKMHDEDANGNGIQDEVIYTYIAGFGNGIADAFGLADDLLGGYKEGVDEYYSNFYHENFPDYIRYMQSLYENGLYDTEALSSSREEMISQDRVSAVFYYSLLEYEDSLPETDDDKVYYKPIHLDMDGDASNGVPMYLDAIGTATYNQYFVPKTCEHPEAVVRLMDFIYSEEYALLSEFGVEGHGYTIDENGNYVKIPGDTDETKSLWGACIAGSVLPEIVTTPSIVESYTEDASASVKARNDWYLNSTKKYYQPSLDAGLIEVGGKQLALATEEEDAFISEKYETLASYAHELLADLILGNKSLDDLPEYQKEMESLGLLEYLDIMQARHDRVVGTK